MAAVVRQLVWLLLGVSCAVAQGAPATLREVKVTQTNKGVQVDVSLSESVQPSLKTLSPPRPLFFVFQKYCGGRRAARDSSKLNGVSPGALQPKQRPTAD